MREGWEGLEGRGGRAQEGYRNEGKPDCRNLKKKELIWS